MRKKILAIGTAILTIGGVVVMASTSYGWAKADIQAPVLKSVATAFNITDMIIANGESNANWKSLIDDMTKELKDTKSKEAKKLLERSIRLWELDRKRLNNAIYTRVQMLATMEKGNPLSML